jgi:purine-binding chemotaxis protein CheW
VTGARQFATFRLDGQLFGVPVLQVREVIRCQALTPVPLAPPAVRGLMNLRGDIVPALDLRQRVGLPPRPPDAEALGLVVAQGHEIVSLLVDEMEDVVDVQGAGLEAVPDHIPAPLREVLVGIYKLRGELLLALDPEQVSSVGAPSRASAPAVRSAEGDPT